MRKLCEQESAYEEEPEAADYEDNEDLLESVDITRNIDEKQYGVLKLISYLMKLMRTYQELLEKHSPEYIFSVIEQKSENDKESNLKFIQE